MSPWPELTQSQIVAAFAGDRGAGEQLCRTYAAPVRWAVVSRFRSRPAVRPYVDDLIQDVWVVLTKDDFKALRAFDVDRGVPLARFAIFCALRIAEKAAKRLRAPTVALGNEAHVHDDWASVLLMLSRRQLDRYSKALQAQLSPVEWDSFVRVWVQGHTAKAVAAGLGLDANTMHKRQERLRAKVASIVAELEGRDVQSGCGLERLGPLLAVILTCCLWAAACHHTSVAAPGFGPSECST